MKMTVKSRILSWLTITVGTLAVACGIYFFKFPNHFSTGGVSGISVLLGGLFPGISAGTYVTMINVVLLLIGFLFLGKSFGIRTVYASLLLSGAIWVLELTVPMSGPLTKQPFLEFCFAVLLPGVGSAILFDTGASTGGTDIVAMILKRKTSLDIGKALFITDGLIATGAFFVFGPQAGLFSVLGLLAKALVVDNIIENINLSKSFTIITDRAHEVYTFINGELRRGATLLDCEGTFTGTEKKMILTVVSRPQAIALRNYTRSIDPHAFIIITSTSEIIGKGFRQTM